MRGRGALLPVLMLLAPATGLADPPTCRDSDVSWWTGRDAKVAAGQAATSPTLPRVIRLTNAASHVLYLPGTTATGIRFELYAQGPDGERKRLELPEHLFCPNLCPAQGPPEEVDCGRPVPTVSELKPGATLQLRWSGEEAATVSRRCGPGATGTPCQLRKATLPAAYLLEVCAFPGVKGGRPANQPDGTVQLRGAMPAGAQRCQSVQFVHPASVPIELSLR